MTTYPTVYVFHSNIIGQNDLAFLPSEFIKFLAEKQMEEYQNCSLFRTFYVYHQVSKLITDDTDLVLEAQSKRALTKKEVKKYYQRAKVWLHEQKQLENTSVAYIAKHPNLTDEERDNLPYYYNGQVNNLYQSNNFATNIRPSYYIWRPKGVYHARWPKAHTTKGIWGNGRVNHPQHNFAKDNHFAKQQRVALVNEYPSAKIRHLNRRHSKRHPIDFPVFDDNEYGTSRHSTGWKYSTKARHQYQIHKKNVKHNQLNKRQFAQHLNDTIQKEGHTNGIPI